MNKKDNFEKKGSNLGPLGCKGIPTIALIFIL
jgi:hypothetical protein